MYLTRPKFSETFKEFLSTIDRFNQMEDIFCIDNDGVEFLYYLGHKEEKCFNITWNSDYAILKTFFRDFETTPWILPGEEMWVEKNELSYGG